MLSTIKSATLWGIDANEVLIEVDAAKGLPTEIIVGLPDTVIKESKSRIKSAIKNVGLEYPPKAFTINLAPADIKKEGPLLDLPIALGMLASTHQININQEATYIGELSLNGEIKSVKGIVSICDYIANHGTNKTIYLPYENLEEASLIDGVELIPVKSLKEFKHPENLKPFKLDITENNSNLDMLDFSDVKGQTSAKRALEIAASGNHNILFIGPPGSGKTMLMKRFTHILPSLSKKEAIETFKIQSISKHSSSDQSKFNYLRPFRSPHHSISQAGLAGGGQNPTPGEISLAHNGILFLDELPEFQKSALEILRQPIEEKVINISRARYSVSYPANFILAAAMNPCPCGYFSDPLKSCRCTESEVKQYWKKVSGPILDRIDIILEIPRLKANDFDERNDINNDYTSEKMTSRIKKAISFSRENIDKSKTKHASTSLYNLDKKDAKLLLNLLENGKLTGRSFEKVIKLSRTIADLSQEKNIKTEHVLEALQYKQPTNYENL